MKQTRNEREFVPPPVMVSGLKSAVAPAAGPARPEAHTEPRGGESEQATTAPDQKQQVRYVMIRVPVGPALGPRDGAARRIDLGMLPIPLAAMLSRVTTGMKEVGCLFPDGKNVHNGQKALHYVLHQIAVEAEKCEWTEGREG